MPKKRTGKEDGEFYRILHFAVALPNKDDLDTAVLNLSKDIVENTDGVEVHLLPCHNSEKGPTGYISVAEGDKTLFDERTTREGIFPFINPKQFWGLVKIGSMYYMDAEILDVANGFVEMRATPKIFDPAFATSPRTIVCPINEIKHMENRRA